MNVSRILLLACVALALPGVARADRIDKRLNDELPAVTKHLKDKGYKNVGVLRFRVQIGKNAAGFDNAPFNGNLPPRVENLLIMNGGSVEDEVVGVIRDASKAARAAKVGDWFGDEAQRKKLFDVGYALAWDDKTVKADAFLTGLVSLSADKKKTTVSLLCFDRKNLEPKEIASFTIPTDRDVIRDLGLSFVVNKKTRSALAAQRSADDVDRGVLESLDEQVQPTDVAGIEIAILVDDKATELKAAKAESPAWRLECPPAKTPVAVRFRNTTDKTMGVVLKLNGLSTYAEQTRPADRCQKWILRAGKSITLKGFYAPDGDRLSLRPFAVLTGEAAKGARAELGDRAGLLEIDVFAEGGEGEEGLEISARGLPPSKEKEKEKDAKAKSYKSVRASLLKDAKLKTETTVAKREILVPDKDAIRADKVKTVDFDGHVVGRLAVQIVAGK